ncbi:acf43848-decc-46af-84fa-7d74dbf699cd [Sclerotinia trifoliorum]|uniref:Spindle pole body component n=1 Tax=Sclerotinia trifoliorum TaxID=28548 RepID=A0A8H2ZPC4_9HELO|nr:acf43848-decc-46af-84fa-7d74dbf699cd [Sclerotinia trifoliorum]
MNSISLIDSLNRVVSISGMEQGESLEVPTTQKTRLIGAIPRLTSHQPENNLEVPSVIPISTLVTISRATFVRELQSQNKGAGWSHKTSNKEIEYWKRRVFILRARMLVFVQQLLNFCTSEVIEPNWQVLMAKLESNGLDGSELAVKTVDELMQDHVKLLDTCLKERMLTNSKLLRRHSKLIQTCTHFASFTGRLSKELGKLDPDLPGPKRPAAMCKLQWERFQIEKSRSTPDHHRSSAADESPLFDKMRDLMDKSEYSFGKGLQSFIDALNHFAATETVVFLGICARLSTVNQGTEFSGLRNEECGED